MFVICTYCHSHTSYSFPYSRLECVHCKRKLYLDERNPFSSNRMNSKKDDKRNEWVDTRLAPIQDKFQLNHYKY